MKRKLVLYIAMSLDGYIAKPNDDIDFLSIVEEEGEDYGYTNFVAGIDAVIVGRKTYEKVLSMGFPFPHTDKEVYIITRTPRPAQGSLQFYSGDLTDLVQGLKSKAGKDIYCDGGAELVNALQQRDLIDEYMISVIPIILGEGVHLFKDGRPEQALELLAERSYPKGLVQLHYRRKRM